MIPFTAGELALNRAPFTADLPDTCRVRRHSWADDGSGSQTETWTPDASTVACRVAPQGRNASEGPLVGGVSVTEAYIVTLAYDAALQAGDQVDWVTAGRRLRVTGPGGRSRAMSRRVLAVEVDEEPNT